jgi:hypothetical protein
MGRVPAGPGKGNGLLLCVDVVRWKDASVL